MNKKVTPSLNAQESINSICQELKTEFGLEKEVIQVIKRFANETRTGFHLLVDCSYSSKKEEKLQEIIDQAFNSLDSSALGWKEYRKGKIQELKSYLESLSEDLKDISEMVDMEVEELKLMSHRPKRK